MLREDFLQQFAFSDVDAYCDPKKQFLMLKVIVTYNDVLQEVLNKGVALKNALELPFDVRIGRMKEIPAAESEDQLVALEAEVATELRKLISY